MNIGNLAMSLAIGVGATAPVAFDSELNPFFGFNLPDNRIEYTERDLRCLARNIYFEARGEPEEGQQAVALVTINRVKNENYPDTICGVVYQAELDRRGNPIRNRCQFSWYCDGRPDVIRDRTAYEEATRIARDALEARVHDFTDGAVFYHANYVYPRWAPQVAETTRIGQHIFYRID